MASRWREINSFLGWISTSNTKTIMDTLATTAVSKGMEGSLIKILGRWESTAFLRCEKIPREQFLDVKISIVESWSTVSGKKISIYYSSTVVNSYYYVNWLWCLGMWQERVSYCRVWPNYCFQHTQWPNPQKWLRHWALLRLTVRGLLERDLQSMPSHDVVHGWLDKLSKSE